MKRVRDLIRKHSQMHHTDRYSQHSRILWPAGINGPVIVYKLSRCVLESRCCRLNSDIAPVSSKESLNIEESIDCGFTLKRVRYMITTHSQMHRTDKYSQQGSVIWPVVLNG